MKKWNQLLALGITLTMASVPCYAYDKMVDGVVAEMEETDVVQKENSNADKMTVKEMLDIPDHYTTKTTYGDKILIIADVPIEIPEVDAIHLKKVKPAVHDSEYYLNMINRLADEPVRQSDLTEYESSTTGKCTIGGVSYDFSFQYGNRWESFLLDLSAEELNVDEKGIYNMETKEYLFETKEMSAKEYQAQAEAVLEKCGLSEFSPSKIQMESFDQEGFNVELGSSMEFSEEQTGAAALIDCEHIVDQIPLTYVDENNFNMYESDTATKAEELNVWISEGVSVRFFNENLINMEVKYPIEISDYSDEDQFLLPFREIRGIFEEMLGWRLTYPNTNGGLVNVTEENGEVVAQVTANSLAEFPYDSIEVKVSEVKLGYMRVRDDEGSDEELEGLLIPVWDFFGTWTAKETGKDGTETELEMGTLTSLLTLDARDGSVVTRMFGY